MNPGNLTPVLALITKQDLQMGTFSICVFVLLSQVSAFLPTNPNPALFPRPAPLKNPSLNTADHTDFLIPQTLIICSIQHTFYYCVL